MKAGQQAQCDQGRGVCSTWVCSAGAVCWAHGNELVNAAQRKRWESESTRQCVLERHTWTDVHQGLTSPRAHAPAGHRHWSGFVRFIHLDSEQGSTGQKVHSLEGEYQTLVYSPCSGIMKHLNWTTHGNNRN